MKRWLAGSGIVLACLAVGFLCGCNGSVLPPEGKVFTEAPTFDLPGGVYATAVSVPDRFSHTWREDPLYDRQQHALRHGGNALRLADHGGPLHDDPGLRLFGQRAAQHRRRGGLHHQRQRRAGGEQRPGDGQTASRADQPDHRDVHGQRPGRLSEVRRGRSVRHRRRGRTAPGPRNGQPVELVRWIEADFAGTSAGSFHGHRRPGQRRYCRYHRRCHHARWHAEVELCHAGAGAFLGGHRSGRDDLHRRHGQEPLCPQA